MTSTIDIEQVVNSKYGLAAQRREEELCCPVEYDTGFLDAIPEEIRKKITVAAIHPVSSEKAMWCLISVPAPERFATSRRRLWDHMVA